MATEFINEYGENLDQLRVNILADTQVVNVLVQGSMRKWLKLNAGVLAIKMVTEILLHLGKLTPSRPLLV